MLNEEYQISDGLLERFMEETTALCFIKDLDGKYLYVNKAFETFFNTSRSNIINKAPTNLIKVSDPQVIKKISDAITEVITKKTKITGEEFYPTQEGVYEHFQITRFPIFNDTNEVAAIAGVAIQITKDADIDKERKDIAERLLFALESSGHALWEWNVPTGEVFLSKEWKLQLGFMDHELINSFDTFKRLLHPDDIESTLTKITEYLTTFKNGKLYDVEFRMKCKSEKYKWINAKGKIITETLEGKPKKFIGTHVDISEKRLLMDTLKSNNEQLKALSKNLFQQNKQLENFANITSHNLRSPLSNMNGLVEMYMDNATQEEKDSYVAMMKEVVEHTLDTLNNLVEIIKVRNSNKLDYVSVNLETSLNKVLTDNSVAIAKLNATLNYDFNNVSSILGIPSYIDSIFQNLVSNSLKYAFPDRPPMIKIYTQKINNITDLVYEDNCLGINLIRHGHQIFGLNKVFHKHPDAKGVGLFMVKNHVEALGGNIICESTENVGTKFTISI
jgi:PAS domain S-box-containing protein